MNFLSIITLFFLLFNQGFLIDTINKTHMDSELFNYEVLILMERRRQLWRERKCLFDYYLIERDLCVSLIKQNRVHKVDPCHLRHGRMMTWKVANQISEASFDSIIREIEIIENFNANEEKICLKFTYKDNRFLCFEKSDVANIWKTCLKERQCYQLCYHSF